MKVKVGEYKKDTLYPRVVRSVQSLLDKQGFVTSIDLFISMGYLDEKAVMDWRMKRIPFLEKVIKCNLSKLSRVLQIMRYHAHDLNLISSVTTYMSYGKGKKIELRFTKTNLPILEEAYSRKFTLISIVNEEKKKKKQQKLQKKLENEAKNEPDTP